MKSFSLRHKYIPNFECFWFLVVSMLLRFLHERLCHYDSLFVKLTLDLRRP